MRAADLQTDIDHRLKTIEKQEQALERWKADSRMISIKGPPPKVPAPITLKENKKFIQYLAEPHEQFARAVHAATVFLNGETLNTHAEPGWEDVMSFDLDEIQAIIHHVTAVFAQHLPVHSGGPGLPGQPGIHPGNANNVGGGYASPGQAPGTPSLAAPGGAAGNDALTPSQPSSHPVPAPRLHSTPRANSTRPLKSNFLADAINLLHGHHREAIQSRACQRF